jgi:hypothetical protein
MRGLVDERMSGLVGGYFMFFADFGEEMKKNFIFL